MTTTTRPTSTGILTPRESEVAEAAFWRFENDHGREPTEVELADALMEAARVLRHDSECEEDIPEAQVFESAARKWRPAHHRLFWIAMMGAESVVEVLVSGGRVYVDSPTLDRMAVDIVDIGLASDEDDAKYAADIRAAKPSTDVEGGEGLTWYEVTEFGGDMWSDQLSDCDAECMESPLFAEQLAPFTTPNCGAIGYGGTADCRRSVGHTGPHADGDYVWPEGDTLTADRARHVAIGVAESIVLRLRAMPATDEMPKVAEALEAVEAMVYGDK